MFDLRGCDVYSFNYTYVKRAIFYVLIRQILSTVKEP